ncbi:MAG: helix-turn-helix domain-containing protein [Oscillospiraceae bacterium]|jgi:transcriptional regulator with XRE-family HTH domain|nr:helix-turn-helix domain-containing protein [Oscillospiraceae bacterium]
MEIYERIKFIRKANKLSQTEFGARLGESRSAINNIEGNRLSKPELKEPLYRLICREFNVRYEWLRTGEGEMFESADNAELAFFRDKYSLTPEQFAIVEEYVTLPAETRTGVLTLILDTADKIRAARERGDAVPPAPKSVDEMSDEEIVALVRKHRALEANSGTSEVLGLLSSA